MKLLLIPFTRPYLPASIGFSNWPHIEFIKKNPRPEGGFAFALKGSSFSSR